MAGTILITPYPAFEKRGPELGCARIGQHVWVTDTTQDEADELAERATEMGTLITPVAHVSIRNSGILSPIAQALNDIGFEVA